MYQTEQFKKDLLELGLSVNDDQIEQFLVFYEMLIKQNEVMNLTAITEYDEVLKKHFIDSLSLVKAVELKTPLSVIDVGTGAGFPGIPLKIAFPHLQITLLDSLQKRVSFLQSVINELNLDDIYAFHGRAEDYARTEAREHFDICVSRAVANLTTLSEYCLPFVKVGGFFISYKSEKITEESKNAEKAISLLGGKISEPVEFLLPNSDFYRNLFIVNKVGSTPKKYPRKAGLPSKEPMFHVKHF